MLHVIILLQSLVGIEDMIACHLHMQCLVDRPRRPDDVAHRRTVRGVKGLAAAELVVTADGVLSFSGVGVVASRQAVPVVLLSIVCTVTSCYAVANTSFVREGYRELRAYDAVEARVIETALRVVELFQSRALSCSTHQGQNIVSSFLTTDIGTYERFAP